MTDSQQFILNIVLYITNIIIINQMHPELPDYNPQKP